MRAVVQVAAPIDLNADVSREARELPRRASSSAQLEPPWRCKMSEDDRPSIAAASWAPPRMAIAAAQFGADRVCADAQSGETGRAAPRSSRGRTRRSAR